MKSLLIIVVALLSMVALSHPVTAALLIWFSVGPTLIWWADDLEIVEKGKITPIKEEDRWFLWAFILVPPFAFICMLFSSIMDDDIRRSVKLWFKVRVIGPIKERFPQIVSLSNLQNPFVWKE